MKRQELLYAVDSLWVAILLLALMLAAMAFGQRFGRSRAPIITQASRDHANALQPSFLTLMALLLAFTFAMSLGRFEVRTEAVVNEANAIGTAWLRTDLLPEPARTEARDLMRSYLAARLAGGSVALTDEEERDTANAEAGTISLRIWSLGADAARSGGVVPMSFGHAVNEMIDSFGRSDASVRYHVPQPVLVLLFLSFIVQGFVVGYCGGISSARATVTVYTALFMTALTVFLILDLDRPRRGLIQVDQRPMQSLAVTLGLPGS